MGMTPYREKLNFYIKKSTSGKLTIADEIGYGKDDPRLYTIVFRKVNPQYHYILRESVIKGIQTIALSKHYKLADNTKVVKHEVTENGNLINLTYIAIEKSLRTFASLESIREKLVNAPSEIKLEYNKLINYCNDKHQTAEE